MLFEWCLILFVIFMTTNYLTRDRYVSDTITSIIVMFRMGLLMRKCWWIVEGKVKEKEKGRGQVTRTQSMSKISNIIMWRAFELYEYCFHGRGPKATLYYCVNIVNSLVSGPVAQGCPTFHRDMGVRTEVNCVTLEVKVKYILLYWGTLEVIIKICNSVKLMLNCIINMLSEVVRIVRNRLWYWSTMFLLCLQVTPWSHQNEPHHPNYPPQLMRQGHRVPRINTIVNNVGKKLYVMIDMFNTVIPCMLLSMLVGLRRWFDSHIIGSYHNFLQSNNSYRPN